MIWQSGHSAKTSRSTDILVSSASPHPEHLVGASFRDKKSLKQTRSNYWRLSWTPHPPSISVTQSFPHFLPPTYTRKKSYSPTSTFNHLLELSAVPTFQRLLTWKFGPFLAAENDRAIGILRSVLQITHVISKRKGVASHNLIFDFQFLLDDEQLGLTNSLFRDFWKKIPGLHL